MQYMDGLDGYLQMANALLQWRVTVPAYLQRHDCQSTVATTEELQQRHIALSVQD